MEAWTKDGEDEGQGETGGTSDTDGTVSEAVGGAAAGFAAGMIVQPATIMEAETRACARKGMASSKRRRA